MNSLTWLDFYDKMLATSMEEWLDYRTFQVPNCNECQRLWPKEEDQTNEKEPHICRFYKKRCYHDVASLNGDESWIGPCKECISDNFKGYVKDVSLFFKENERSH